MDAAANRQGKLWLVGAVVALSFVGFVLGSGPHVDHQTAPSGASAHEPSSAPPARSNEELASDPWRRSESFSLQREMPAAAPNPQLRGEALTRRAERRAFLSAPPTIPHPVAQNSGTECRSCHERGAVIGDRIAPPMSHPVMAMCTQCHVPDTSVFATSKSVAATVASNFQPLARGPASYQYGPDSPPQVPHSRWMRQECGSCHGPLGHPGLQTSHPERQSCEQCHTSSALANQLFTSQVFERE